MKIEINIEKKHVYFLTAVLVFLAGMTVFAAQPLNLNLPWHPLQQVTTDDVGNVSVDSDANSKIDDADDVTCTNCVNPGEVNFNFAGSNEKGGGALACNGDDVCEAVNLDVSGQINVGKICLGGVCRNSWPIGGSEESGDDGRLYQCPFYPSRPCCWKSECLGQVSTKSSCKRYYTPECDDDSVCETIIEQCAPISGGS